MKTILFFALLLNTVAAFSAENFVFGEWFVNGAICTANGRDIKCPELNEKISISHDVSSCGSFQIKLTALELNEKKALLFNNCENSTSETNLFPIDTGYHYYKIEKFKSGLDIVLFGSSDFIEIYIYSSSVEKGCSSRRYFLSKNLVP